MVAVVDSAAPDSQGLRISGRWTSTDAAQRLREMARRGVPLGLSIDYTVKSSRPDGAGGRVLTSIAIYGGAVTNAPMNPQCVIISGKDTASVQVLTVGQSIAAETARHQREHEAPQQRRGEGQTRTRRG